MVKTGTNLRLVWKNVWNEYQDEKIECFLLWTCLSIPIVDSHHRCCRIILLPTDPISCSLSHTHKVTCHWVGWNTHLYDQFVNLCQSLRGKQLAMHSSLLIGTFSSYDPTFFFFSFFNVCPPSWLWATRQLLRSQVTVHQGACLSQQ